MLVLSERVVDVPIMSLQTGEEIARTESPIIDPRQLHIVAFYCSGQRLDHNPAILHIEDIREISSLGYIVDSADKLMAQDDLVRLKQIIDFKFELIDKHVIEDTGNKVGKVSNYTVDTPTFQIQQLHVTPGIWKALQTSEVIIHRRQIVEITDAAIVVRSASVKAKQHEPVAEVAEPVDNPFRNPHPQPETAHTSDSTPA